MSTHRASANKTNKKRTTHCRHSSNSCHHSSIESVTSAERVHEGTQLCVLAAEREEISREWEVAEAGNGRKPSWWPNLQPQECLHQQNGAAVVAVESLEALEMAGYERPCQPDMSAATDRESSRCEGMRSYAP